MIYEVAELTVEPERRAEFAEAYLRAWTQANLASARNLRFMPCVEDRRRVAVVIEWDSVEAHDRYRLEHRAWMQLSEAERATRPVPKMAPFRNVIDGYVKDRSVVHYEAEDLGRSAAGPHPSAKPVRARQ